MAITSRVFHPGGERRVPQITVNILVGFAITSPVHTGGSYWGATGGYSL